MEGKKEKILANAKLDPISGKLITSSYRIRETSLRCCLDTLTNYEPDIEYIEERRKKKIKCMQFLQEGTGNLTIERKTFNFIVSKFQRSKRRNYDLLVKAGKRFQNAVFNFS